MKKQSADKLRAILHYLSASCQVAREHPAALHFYLPHQQYHCMHRKDQENDFNWTWTFGLGTTRTFCFLGGLNPEPWIGPCAHIPPQSRVQLLTQVSDSLLSGTLGCPLQDSAHCFINILTALKIFRGLQNTCMQ